MWSYTFTSTRSQLFNEEHRLGLHAEAPGARRAFSSEGAMREVMRGAILPQNLEGAIVGAAATGCRFLLCDRGSEFTVREILADMLSSVDRAKFRIVARLSADCHAGQDAAARQCLQMMRGASSSRAMHEGGRSSPVFSRLSRALATDRARARVLGRMHRAVARRARARESGR